MVSCDSLSSSCCWDKFSKESQRPYRYVNPLRSMDQDTYINGFAGAVNITLTPEELKYLEEPYLARSVMGH